MAQNEVPPPDNSWFPYAFDEETSLCNIPLTVLDHFVWSPAERCEMFDQELNNRLDKIHLKQIIDGKCAVLWF